MSDKFQPLDPEEVVHFAWDDIGKCMNLNSNQLHSCTLLADQLSWTMIRLLNIHEPFRGRLFTEGVEAEVLRFGAKGLQKGKMRINIVVEFCPDEPEIEQEPEIEPSSNSKSESPLDDIRKQLNFDS